MTLSFSQQKNFLSWFLALIILVFSCWVYAFPGIPYTHDGENHLARFGAYKIALREGQIPPRFAGNLLNNYGYPVFNFNYPLANISALPGAFLKWSYQGIFKGQVLLAGVIALIGMWLWIRQRWGRGAWLVSAAAFFWSPYWINLVWVRGNIGELWALSLFALFYAGLVEKNYFCRENKLVCSAEIPQCCHRGIIAICGLMLLLSHNLLGPVFFLLAIMMAGLSAKCSLSWLRQNSLGLLLAVGASLWFWLPALAEKNLTVMGEVALTQQTMLHFPTFSQLLQIPLAFGYSFPGGVDSMNLGLGISLVGGTIFLVLIRLVQRQTPNVLLTRDVNLVGWTIVALLAVFFQLELSKSFWLTLSPLAQFWQFPWRIAAIFVVAALPLTAASWRWGSNVMRFMLLSMLVIQGGVVLSLHPADLIKKTNDDYDHFPESTSTQHENRTREFTFMDIGDWRPTPAALGTATFTVQRWSGSRHEYRVQANGPVEIIEPTMFFPGWETSVTPLGGNGENRQAIVRMPLTEGAQRREGRIAYQLQPGLYQVVTQFTQNTWARIIGNSVSVFTLFILAAWVVYPPLRGGMK